VKFGFALFAFAAGAAPPPPPPLAPLPLFPVVVVVLPVVSVDVVPVDALVEPVLDVSGVVVVIVVTTVLLPVVIVEVIVVVACAPNGAAPAVNAAVAAPKAIRTAKAAPQRASFRYLLVMRFPYPARRKEQTPLAQWTHISSTSGPHCGLY